MRRGSTGGADRGSRPLWKESGSPDLGRRFPSPLNSRQLLVCARPEGALGWNGRVSQARGHLTFADWRPAATCSSGLRGRRGTGREGSGLSHGTACLGWEGWQKLERSSFKCRGSASPWLCFIFRGFGLRAKSGSLKSEGGALKLLLKNVKQSPCSQRGASPPRPYADSLALPFILPEPRVPSGASQPHRAEALGASCAARGSGPACWHPAPWSLHLGLSGAFLRGPLKCPGILTAPAARGGLGQWLPRPLKA